MTEDAEQKYMQAQLKDLEEQHSPVLVNLLKDILETQRDIKKQVEGIKTRMNEMTQTLTSTSDAFVNKDYDGHRRYHQSVIDWHETRNTLVKAALIQAAKVGGAGAIVWIGYAIWQAIKMEILK